jgi:hypothetical protein
MFCRFFLAELVAAGPFMRNTVTAARINALQVLVARLDALMLWPGMKVINAKLRAADRMLDHSLSMLVTQVRHFFRFSDNPVLVEAATRLLDMLEHYGKVGRKNYEAEVGIITSILANLNGAYAADVTALGIGALKDALQAALDNFTALIKERDDLDNARPKGPDGKNDTFAKVRKAIIALYREIEAIINSGAELQLSQEFPPFIAKINPEIVRLNSLHHRALRSLKDAQIAPIADQPWTGIPATPPIKVYFVLADGTIVLLILGKDYNVTYDKNIDVGNARCTIHGKGGYKDSQTVTFVIKRGPLNAAAAAAAEEEFRRELEAKAETAKAAKAAKAGMVAKGEGI